MTGECSNCTHAAGLDGTDSLLCRRYPPQVLSDGNAVVQTQPVVEPTDSCGEHQPGRGRRDRARPPAPAAEPRLRR